jgi:outer membrane protein assembly factor BamB
MRVRPECRRNRRLETGISFISAIALVCVTSLLRAGTVQGGDWPMLAHDPARSGATATEIRPPFERKWYRLFPDEGLMAGVQPVIAGGKAFVGTMRGMLHAMDADTGQDVWVYRTDGAILHTCAVDGGKVVFGDSSGKIGVVNVGDGTLAWSVRTDSAVWNAPLTHRGTAFVGSRDGSLYVIDVSTGTVKWKGPTRGPLLSSPALDVKRSRVYVASEDMCVYAFAYSDGRRVWQSPKLPGVSFRGYHPVVAPDGSVMVTVTPSIGLDSFEPILMGMVKEVFGDFASWRHKKEENDRLREANFKKMAEPGTYEAQVNYIRKRLAEEPIYQTFFVLDPNTGQQKFVTPIVYAESMNGTSAPPIVTADGKVIVKFQALLRSRYEHYSPFLNVGYLDTATGHITPIMDQLRTYGWHDSLLLVHDEQCQLSAAGRVLINTHQDNVNAMDLGTLRGYEQPFCRNVHEPKAGEAIGIWAAILRNEPLPVGKEWLARGTAVYGGGSVIDTAVSVAGDSFYYVPTHEINAGAAVIAYRMAPGGKAGQEAQAPAAKLTDQEWAKVQELPWDWDILRFQRLSHVLVALPEKVPGTAQNPLTQQAAQRVSQVTDDELDRFIWQTPAAEATASKGLADLKAKLASHVRELISQEWRPLLFPPGKHPREAYRIFADPTETLLTLALAYPHVDPDLQSGIRQYVKQLSRPGGPLEGLVGRHTVDPGEGAVRSYYDIAADKLFRVTDDITRGDVARLYPLWLWACATNDWQHIESNWGRLKTLVDQPANKMEEDCRNGYLAGLIAYCRMADHMRDEESCQKGRRITHAALRDRLIYEFAHTQGGLISEVPVSRSIFARWRHLTPEVGHFLAHYAGGTHRHLMDVYVDYHRPTWYLAWGVETLWRNESPFAFPTMPAEIFAARAWILNEPAEKLASSLDIPWCKADLFYLQKLALCIER